MTKRRDKTITLIAAVLIALALLSEVLILYNQNRKIMQFEEDHLSHLATSIDSNIYSVINGRKYALLSLKSDYYVRTAEKTWLDSGSSEEFLSLLSQRLLENNDITKSVLVFKDGKIALSTDGETGYDTNVYEENRGLKPCITPDGSIGLLMMGDEDFQGVQIGMLINLEEFYREIVSPETALENWILLLDSNSSLMIHYQSNKVLADPIDAVSGATCGPDGIELIKSIQLKEVPGYGTYEYWDAENESEHIALLSVIPSAETKSGYFAVGVATQMDEKNKMINGSTFGYAISAVVFMLSIGVIAWYSRKDRIKIKENEEELRILREKNKEMEELEKRRSEMAHADRLETIGTLTSSISHEFNNLLTPIMADAALALDVIDDDDKELGDYLETIYNSSIRAKRLVSRLSFLSSKSNDDIKSVISVEQLISRASDSASPIKPENVELSVMCDEELQIYGNELLLHQMLLNLILNAYQAMEETGGYLLIEAKQKADKVVISVEDSGKGIPKELQEKVFDPFFTTKGSGKGTGLGLAICKQVAEDNNGKIDLKSEPGKGTKFILTFPAAKE